MNRQQKIIAAVAVGAVVLYLIYRWQRGSTTGATGTTAGTSPSSSDYAALAGQEQSDMAALQGQGAQLFSQEQSDVAALQGSLGTVGAQEQSDVSGLTGVIGSLTSTVDNLAPPDLNPIEQQIAALATGQQQLNRAVTATITPNKGHPFYNYYVKVTGHAPPAKVQVSNFVYQAWRSGVHAAALQSNPTHNSAPRQVHVAHPNPGHSQQSNVAPRLPAGRRPPAPHRARPSGRRG